MGVIFDSVGAFHVGALHSIMNMVTAIAVSAAIMECDHGDEEVEIIEA